MYTKRKISPKSRNKILFWSFFAFFAVLLVWTEQTFTPLLVSYVHQQAERLVTDTVNRTVSEWLSENSCGSFIHVERTAQGEIQALQADTVQISKVQTALNLAVQKELSQSSVHTLTVPLGTLLGSHFLRERGPSVTTRFAFASSAVCALENRFHAAGINQTQHEVWLTVTATVYVMLPTAKVPIKTEISYCLSQTILVGSVPNVYVSQQ